MASFHRAMASQYLYYYYYYYYYIIIYSETETSLLHNLTEKHEYREPSGSFAFASIRLKEQN